MVKHKYLFCLLIVTLLISVPVAAEGSRVVIVLWHDLDWDTLKNSSFLQEHDLAIGVMNTRIGGGTQTLGAYLTISSGSRAYAVLDAGKTFALDENYRGQTAAELYMLRTGLPLGQAQLVFPDLNLLKNVANQASYPLHIGYLAELLQSAGYEVAAYGNSDTSDEIMRLAGMVAMNANGTINAGNISKDLLLVDPEYPFGIHTDYALLLDEVQGSYADLVVIDLGDPYRYSAYEKYLFPEQRTAIRGRMVEEAWDFLIQLQATMLDAKMMIISPYSGETRASLGQWFAPIVIVDEGEGLLYSGTTKWPGIVSNIDVAPTILSWFDVPKAAMLGRPITYHEPLSDQEPIDTIVELENAVFQVSKYRSLVLRVVVVVQIILYLASLGLLIIPRTLQHQIIWPLQACLLFSLSLPLLLLVASKWWLFLVVAVGLVTMTIYYWPDHLKIISVITLVTTVFLIGDVLSGSWLMRFSVLGYDALGGARYYGIGNEYMGILIGTLIMGWSIMREYRPLKSGIVDFMVFALVTVIVAAPQLGTNVGGAIAAVMGFGVTWLALKKVRWRLRTVVLLGCLVLVMLGGLMLADSWRTEAEQSHIGQTVALIKSDGLEAIMQIISRKLAMNLRLFRYSIWSRALIVAIVAMGGSLIWPSRYLHWLLRHHPTVVQGIAGTLVGTVTALLVNDSGVVAAATCSFYAATTMLTMALSLKHDLLPAQTDIE